MRRLLSTLLLPLLCGTLSAQETLIREMVDAKSDTHIEVLSLFSAAPPTGFVPVRVKIVNNLKTARNARLEFNSESNNYGSGSSNAKSSFGFEAGPGKTITRDILVPVVPPQVNSYSDPRIGLKLWGSMGEGIASVSNPFAPDQAAVLISEALYTPNGSSLAAAVTTSSGYRSGGSEFGARFDPKQLPDQWLAFSGFDSMLMLDSDWAAVPAASRHAILSWVRMGGQLVIFAETAATAAELGLPDEASLGEIVIQPISSRTLDAAETVKLVNKLTGGQPKQVSLVKDFQSAWPLQDVFGMRDFRYGLFIAVLIIFGIVVGPVNLFVLAKSGRRHKLFITTPLISLVASLLLVGLILFQDGFGGSGMRLVHMEVRPDEGLNSAYVHQEQFARTGVLTATRFTMETPAAMVPVPIGETRWSRYTETSSKGAFSLQPADGKLIATGDWFQSRSEHGHVLEAVVPTRGRIERTPDPQVCLSTFDFPIKTLVLLGDDGQWSRATDIQPGKRFNLTPIDKTMAEPFINDQVRLFAQRGRTQLNRLVKRRGHYIAVTGDAPGLESHPGIRWQQTTTVITGPVIAP